MSAKYKRKTNISYIPIRFTKRVEQKYSQSQRQSSDSHESQTQDTKSGSLWSWNQTQKPKSETNLLFPVSDFLEKANDSLLESLLRSGGGARIGCGVGLGVGVFGGIDFSSSQWNQLRLVVGAGMGCGLGLGIGYGQGFGYGYSLASLVVDSLTTIIRYSF